MSHGFISGWHLIFRQGSCSESGLPKGQGWTAGAPEAVSDKGSGSFPETESEPKCFTVLLPHLLTYSWRKALKLGWPWHYHPNWDSKSESESCSVVSDCLRSHGLYSPWNSPGQNTGSGSLSLLQGIFPTQGSNPGLPHCWWILYQLSHKINIKWMCKYKINIKLMYINFSILAWRIPWIVESLGPQRVRHNWMTFIFTFNIIIIY